MKTNKHLNRVFVTSELDV